MERRVTVRATYDAEADAAYIYFSPEVDDEPIGPVDTVPVDPPAVRGMINLDLIRGQLIGIEIIDASKMLPASLLAQLRESE